MAFVAFELTGMVALVLSYNVAQTTTSNVSEFAWFWLGIFLLELPIIWLIVKRATLRTMRTALLLLYGMVSYAPKLLRNPVSPLYHDEFAHWRATDAILRTGMLFQPDPILSIVSRFPGLHATTAALVHITGLTIWQAGTILLIIFHVMLVLGIAALAQSLGMTNRTSSIIAILYGLNSSFLYFDTQYAYESMAITLVVWTLVAFVRAIRSHWGRGRFSWSGLTVVLSAATVVTHHLSTFALALLMVLISIALSTPWLARGENWGQAAVTAWSLTLVTALLAGTWYSFVAPATWSYLSPFIGKGLSELMQVANGSGVARQLFRASLSPWWEQKAAYLVPVFALGVAVGGLLIIRARIRKQQLPRGRRRALLFAFAFLGIIYFPSTVFILAPSGTEGARRSWAFTWIGLCFLAGPAVVWLLERGVRRANHWRHVSLCVALLTGLAVTLVGGTAAGLNASYRLPGPFLYGSDARSVTPELFGASKWFSAHFGTGHNIVTDRYTGLVFGSIGLQNPAAPSPGFPVYNLYLAKPGTAIEPPFLLFELSTSEYTYMIVDAHMAYDFPEVGIYFIPGEPASLDRPQAGNPIFHGTLDGFIAIKWMVRVFQSDNYSIYRLNLPPTKTGYQPRPPKLRGKLPQGSLVVTREKLLWSLAPVPTCMAVGLASMGSRSAGEHGGPANTPGRLCQNRVDHANLAHSSRIDYARRVLPPSLPPARNDLYLLCGSA
jgi:hypothetical protein